MNNYSAFPIPYPNNSSGLTKLEYATIAIYQAKIIADATFYCKDPDLCDLQMMDNSIAKAKQLLEKLQEQQ